MRNDIRFAGIALAWNTEYAIAYAEKLIEMGYFAKVMTDKTVAYSHRPFSRQDAEVTFDALNRPEG
jgi:hypothetical protein